MSGKQKALIKIAYQLLEFYKSGALNSDVMPEDSNPGFPENSEEALRYFTLPMALNFQRNSFSLWKGALQTWEDPTTRFVFDPAQVVQTSFEDLQKALLKYKVALQPNKHVQIWQTICTTIVDDFEGSFLKLLKSHQYDIGKILNHVTVYKKKFPYLAGPKLSNYWLYVLSNYTKHPFKNQEALSIAVDTHVMQASVYLGLVTPEMNNIKVAAAWAELLKDSGLMPFQLHAPLWLWSRQGFMPKVDP